MSTNPALASDAVAAHQRGAAPAASNQWLRWGTLAPALLIAALLGFAAFTKVYAPNPKQVALDYATAGLESLVLLALLVLHRRWAMWGFITIFFAGLAGFAFFKSAHGEACGCFAAFWEPPKYFTFVMDVVIVLVASGLMLVRGATMYTLAGIGALALASGGAGWAFADAVTPPKRSETMQKHGGKTAMVRLLESPALADIRAQEPGGPAWMIFAYDPTCHICEALKPYMLIKEAELTETQDPVLQIRQLSIPELEKSVGIEAFAWETPTLAIVQDGVITRQWTGVKLEGWTIENLQTIHDELNNGTFVPEPPAAAASAAPATPAPAK